MIQQVFENFQSTESEGDYIKDGLLYCGKCNTPKESRKMFLGSERLFACLCACQAEKLRIKEEEDEKQRLIERIIFNKGNAFNDVSLLKNTFDQDDNSLPVITNACKRYVDNFASFFKEGRGLLFHGLVDGGKTFFADCILNALLDQGYPCKATSFPDLASKSFADFDKTDFYTSFNSYDLLLIDDMGTERRTDYMQEIIYGVIDTRYTAKLPMIITTNLSLEDIKRPEDISNKRIFSRILERCHPIEIRQTEHRLKNGRNEFVKTRHILGV
jgi:DNA replication protein DnaC